MKYISVNTLLLPLNLALAWMLTELGLHYLLATLAGFTLHVTISFFINRGWTFKKPETQTRNGLFRAALVEVGTIVIVLCVTAGFVELAHTSFLTARIYATLLAGVWSYIMDSLFTFQVKPFK